MTPCAAKAVELFTVTVIWQSIQNTKSVHAERAFTHVAVGLIHNARVRRAWGGRREGPLTASDLVVKKITERLGARLSRWHLSIGTGNKSWKEEKNSCLRGLSWLPIERTSFVSIGHYNRALLEDFRSIESDSSLVDSEYAASLSLLAAFDLFRRFDKLGSSTVVPLRHLLSCSLSKHTLQVDVVIVMVVRRLARLRAMQEESSLVHMVIIRVDACACEL